MEVIIIGFIFVLFFVVVLFMQQQKKLKQAEVEKQKQKEAKRLADIKHQQEQKQAEVEKQKAKVLFEEQQKKLKQAEVEKQKAKVLFEEQQKKLKQAEVEKQKQKEAKRLQLAKKEEEHELETKELNRKISELQILSVNNPSLEDSKTLAIECLKSFESPKNNYVYGHFLDNHLVYIGKGTKKRYNQRAGRDGPHNKMWHSLIRVKLLTGLNEEEALGVENKMINKVSNKQMDNILNKSRGSTSKTKPINILNEITEQW